MWPGSRRPSSALSRRGRPVSAWRRSGRAASAVPRRSRPISPWPRSRQPATPGNRPTRPGTVRRSTMVAFPTRPKNGDTYGIRTRSPCPRPPRARPASKGRCGAPHPVRARLASGVGAAAPPLTWRNPPRAAQGAPSGSLVNGASRGSTCVARRDSARAFCRMALGRVAESNWFAEGRAARHKCTSRTARSVCECAAPPQPAARPQSALLRMQRGSE
eukprot:5232996-Prymnesium_polylepis.3